MKADKRRKPLKTALRSGASARDASLDTVFNELVRLLSVHVPPFTVSSGEVRNKRDLHLRVPTPVAIPGAYGGQPVAVAMASIILQKGYVGFYYMPVYIDRSVEPKLPRPLLRLRKGKSCFRLKDLRPEIRDGLVAALRLGATCFRQRGWI